MALFCQTLSHIVIVLLTLQCFHQGNSQSFETFKAQAQADAKRLAEAMQKIYQTRRTNQSITSCNRKSYDFCLGYSQGKQCITGFPTPQGYGCPQKSGAFLKQDSALRFPNIDRTKQTAQQKQFACASAYLQPELSNLLTESSSEQWKYTFSYFGSSSGGFRIIPSFKYFQDASGNCEDYDPRIRPWYAAGVSGVKNLVIMLPTERRIDTGNRFQIVNETAQVILKTFSYFDYFNVILYNNEAKLLNSSVQSLTRADQKTTDSFQGLIGSLNSSSFEGDANYEKAFNKAFDLFDSFNYGRDSPCANATNVIIMLVYGAPGFGQTQNSIKAVINGRKDTQDGNGIPIRYNPSIFIYGIGISGSDYTVARSISSSYNGKFLEITGNTPSETVAQVSQYYNFISQITPSYAWSQPYDDRFRLGRLITVSYPAFFTEDGKRITLGVAGIDIRIPYIQQKFSIASQQELIKKIQNPRCFSDLELQNSQISPSVSGAVSIYVELPLSNDSICCPNSSVGAIVGGVVGGVLGIVVIVIVVYLVYAKVIKKENKKPVVRAEGPQDISPQSAADIIHPKEGQLMNQKQRQRYIEMLNKI